MEYCTYLTIYSGTLMPKRYIGSTSRKRINEGYHGSVGSKLYKNLWKDELLKNPHLFKTRVLCYYNSREEALKAELELQIKYDVVKSKNYINMSLARPNGFFGKPMLGTKMSPEACANLSKAKTGVKNPKLSERFKVEAPFSGKSHTEETKMLMSAKTSGKNHNKFDCRPIVRICKTTGEIKEFESKLEASKALGLSNSGNISRACNKSCAAYGYFWKYK